MKPAFVPSRLSLSFLFIISLTLFFGCHEDSPASLTFNSPHVTIVEGPTLYIDSTFHNVNIKATVRNDGDGPTAFNIGYFIKLKNGNHIVDHTGLFFGTLRHNESITETIWFTKIKSLSEYTTKEAVLYWYDAENTYYQ
jgi:hypothetical protein